MLKSLHIKNFRLFRDLKLDPINRVNLVAGENNSGKTALLEALYLLFGDFGSFSDFPSALRSSFAIDQTRGHALVFADVFESFWKWLFNQKDLLRPLEIEAVDHDAGYVVSLNEQSLRHNGRVSGGVSLAQRVKMNKQALTDFNEFELDYFKDHKKVSSSTVSRGNGCREGDKGADSYWPKLIVFSTNPSSPTEDAEYFNRIAAKRGGEQRVVELLQVIEPRLQDLKYLKLGSQPLVYADVGMEDLIPTTQLGQGFTRLLRLFSEILVAKSEIVLIDEIENGIHYSAMPKVWKGISTIARQEDLQFFATTHSYECIRSAHEAFSSEPTYDLALHRLERDDAGNVRAVTLDRESLDTSLKLEWEVR